MRLLGARVFEEVVVHILFSLYIYLYILAIMLKRCS